MKRLKVKNSSLIIVVILVSLALSKISQATLLKDELTQDVAATIIKLSDPNTGIPPSHYGHPGLKHLSFVYDLSVEAMMLKMSGHQEEAERIMDYFVNRLNTPSEQIKAEVDSNNVLGVLKVMSSDAKTVGLVNAIDISSKQSYGHGQLEFLTTPGPISFMIMAFLQINKEKYLSQAIQLGKAALSMQREDGGIYDGDRSTNKVHTEPHLDTANAFLQLYEVTKDDTWKIASDKAIAWFRKNVFISQTGEIYQGIWEGMPNKIFATDVYSWTMSGQIGDLLSIPELEDLTATLLNKCLSEVTLELPGGIKQTTVMADFTDSRDVQAMIKRNGFHPMGSPEWSGGVILALQKNAVRFWNRGHKIKARYYKAMAEYLTGEVLKSSYKVKDMTFFPYATGQAVDVGHGWKTPYFYVKNSNHPIEGGSLVGGWVVMPMNGFNPFILEDKYFTTYEKIDMSNMDYDDAVGHIAGLVSEHRYEESIVTELVDGRSQIVEPNNFNTNAWKAFNDKKYQEAIAWAKKVLEDFNWVDLAKKEEDLKEHKIGGIINYVWGQTYPNNENPIHLEIWKYPMLNEVATSMWIMANSYYELKQFDKTKYWVKRIITEVPLHQIAHMIPNPHSGKPDLIDGYWNALISWDKNPYQNQRDIEINDMINQMGLKVEIPRIIDIHPLIFAKSDSTKTS